METNWQAVIAARAGETTDRVFAVEHEGRRYWVKRVMGARVRPWHRWLDRVARITRIDVLRRTADADADGRAALAREARIIRGHAAAGVRVPELMAVTPDWIVLADMGESLRGQLGRAESRGEAVALAEAGARALVRLHAAGRCHGNAQARNLAGEPERLGFIDFEEDVAARMALPAAQLRDWVLYLMSLEAADTRHGGVLTAAVRIAESGTPRAVRRRLRLVRRFVWPLACALRPLRRRLGRDWREAIALGLALRELQNAAERRRARLIRYGALLIGLAWTWEKLIDAG